MAIGEVFRKSLTSMGTEEFWMPRKIGLKTFTERYQNFCKKHHYIFQTSASGQWEYSPIIVSGYSVYKVRKSEYGFLVMCI